MFMLIVSQGLWCFIIFVCKRNVMKVVGGKNYIYYIYFKVVQGKNYIYCIFLKVVRGKSKRLYSMARQLSRAMSSECISLIVTIGEHAQ